MRDVAMDRPRRVVFKASGVVLQQPRRGTRCLDLVKDGARLGARYHPIRQPLELSIEHEPAADLEDERRRSDQPRGLEDARLLAAGMSKQIDCGPCDKRESARR